MSTVTVLYGHAYDGKNEDAFRKCLEKIRRQEGDTCVYLVRSDVRVRQLRDEVLRELSGCFAFPVFTFPDFIRKIYHNSPGAKRVIGTLEQNLIIADLLRQRTRADGSQSFFTHFRQYPGLLARINEFLTSVRWIGIASPQALTERFSRCSDRRQHIHAELVQIFQGYVEHLQAANVIDDAGIFLELAQRAVSDHLEIRAQITSPELLVLEGYYELTPPVQQIFNALYAQFGRTILTLDTPCNPYNFPAEPETSKPFRIFREIVQYIHTSGFSLHEFGSPMRHRDIEAQKHAENEKCFATLGLHNIPSEQKLSIKSYRNRNEEVTEIAREIRTLYRDGKTMALREIGVTFPVIEQYERLIREIFPLFGIPFTMFQGYSLASSPVIVTIFRLLQVVLDDYSCEVLRNLFSSPLIQFETINFETYPQLDSLARSLGIVGGKQAWQKKLTQYQTELEQQKTEDRRRKIEDRRQKIDNEIPKIESTLPVVSCLLDFLFHFETVEPRPVVELIDLLREGIQRFQIPLKILQSKPRNILEQHTSALRTFFKILDSVKQAYTGTHLEQSDRLTLQEFGDLLRFTIQGETYYSPEILDDSVFIMGRLDTRQVQFKYLFFGGLVERDFPGQAEPNMFLSEQESEAFGLPTYQKRVQEADHLFYLNILNPSAKLYLSYPLQEGETELLRSAHVERIISRRQTPSQPEGNSEEQISVGKGVQTSVCNHNIEHIFTYTELYQWLGAHLQGAQASCLPAGVEAVLQLIEAEKGKDAITNFLNGLQAQKLRMSNQLSHFEGILSASWSKVVLHHRYVNHIYAVSEFDHYVRCPIRFFLQRLLHLQPLPELVTEIPAQEIGALLHRIVYRFYTGDAAQSLLCASLQGNVDPALLQRKHAREQWIQEARSSIYQIACEELDDYDFSGVFWERFTNSLLAGLQENAQHKQGLLAAFIEQEADDPDKAVPCYLEAHFGMTTFPNTEVSPSLAEEVEGRKRTGYVLSMTPLQFREKDEEGRTVTVKIRGTIDRIDVEPAHEHGKRRVVIYDYKTGAAPSVQNIKEGLSFQLPLYLLAVQNFFGEAYEVVAGGYYQLQSPHDLGKKGHLGSKKFSEQHYFKGYAKSLFDTHAEFLRLLEAYQTRTVSTAQAIKTGRFHPTALGPQDAKCDYCEYNQICRVDHQKMTSTII
jgi:ATP-dependent helicase/nuclease subunit B